MTYDELINISFWVNMGFRLGIAMLLTSFLISLVTILEKIDGRKRPLGVKIFSVLLIMGSLYKLWGFWSYGYYRFMFQPLTEEAIFLRYCLSVGLRLAGLIIAVGVLFLKNIFRKTLLLLSFSTLCLLYWKHPFFVFENIARYNEQFFLNRIIVTELVYPAYPWISLIFNYAIDIGFSLAILRYFTRPQIKEHFKRL